MATNNPLIANDFSFFDSHSLGYEKKKSLVLTIKPLFSPISPILKSLPSD